MIDNFEWIWNCVDGQYPHLDPAERDAFKEEVQALVTSGRWEEAAELKPRSLRGESAKGDDQ